MQTISIRCTETAYRSLYESTETDKTSVILGDNTRFDDFDFFIFCKERHILSRDEYRICERTCKFVRKTAHFTEYAVLGFFTYKAVSCDVLDRKKAVLTAQLISTGYASTDEIHQMFVPGREGKVFDVMIDSCGAFCGIMVSLITQKLIKKKKGNQI